MTGEPLSFILRCRPLANPEVSYLEIIDADGHPLAWSSRASFLVRIHHGHPLRCTIRDLATDAELFIQGGPDLRALIDEWLPALIQPSTAQPHDGPNDRGGDQRTQCQPS